MNSLKRILLVEDNDADVELTLEALKEANLYNEVTVVRNGEEALDFLFRKGKFAERTPDNPALILLDLKMPKVDGLQVLKKLKSDERLKRIPVVMLTSSAEESDTIQSYSLGVNAYVVKPVDFKEFLSAVKQLGVFWGVVNEPPPGSAKTTKDQ